MAAKAILVEGGMVIPDPASGIVGGQTTFAATTSAVTVTNLKPITEDVMFSFSGGVKGPIVNIVSLAPAPATPTVEKTITEKKKPIREGDEIQLSCQGQDPQGKPAPLGPVKFVVQQGGQVKLLVS